VIEAMSGCDYGPYLEEVKQFLHEVVEKQDWEVSLVPIALMVARTKESACLKRLLPLYSGQEEVARAICLAADELTLPAVFDRVRVLPPMAAALIAPIFESSQSPTFLNGKPASFGVSGMRSAQITVKTGGRRSHSPALETPPLSHGQLRTSGRAKEQAVVASAIILSHGRRFPRRIGLLRNSFSRSATRISQGLPMRIGNHSVLSLGPFSKKWFSWRRSLVRSAVSCGTSFSHWHGTERPELGVPRSPRPGRRSLRVCRSDGQDP